MISIHEAAAQGTFTLATLGVYKRTPHFNVNEVDQKGRTPLAYAALKSHFETIKLLIEEGADVNLTNDKKRTALWYASHSHSTVNNQQRRDVLEYLLHKGADPNVQAEDGTTALVKLIEHREPGAIRLLVQKGASTNVEFTRGSTTMSIETLAKETKDEAVIQALKKTPGKTTPGEATPDKPPLDKASNKTEVVIGIVNFILKSIGFMNHRFDGVVKTMFGIKGDVRQSLTCVSENIDSSMSNTADIPPENNEANRARVYADVNATSSSGLGELGGHRTLVIKKDAEQMTPEEFQKDMMKFIEDSGLEYFFEEGSEFLTTIAKKAVELQGNTENLLNTRKDIQDITKLALYQPVFYCDDSGSMKKGTRQQDQIDLVKRVARISTLLVPENYGAGLLFINDECKMDPTLKADQIEQLMTDTTPSGKTRIGTQLEEKILKPLIYDVIKRGEKVERPVLVSCITDGRASGEPSNKFQDVIAECVDFLIENGYPAETVRFQISQIGNDAEAASFLEKLRGVESIKDVLYCTTQRLDDEYKNLKENEEGLERWLLETLMGPITSLGSE